MKLKFYNLLLQKVQNSENVIDRNIFFSKNIVV